MKNNSQYACAIDQRIDERIVVRRAGKLFVPAEDSTLDCTVIDLSVGGAGVHCPDPPPLNAFVVLYVDGFGRFEGVATRFIEGELGLKFICKAAKRDRLKQALVGFVCEGMTGVTRLRRYPRMATSTEISNFKHSSDEPVDCEFLDVSFHDALLKTVVRPQIGEVDQLGQTRGWVVQHHEQGIGVEFQQRPQSGQVDGR